MRHPTVSDDLLTISDDFRRFSAQVACKNFFRVVVRNLKMDGGALLADTVQLIKRSVCLQKKDHLDTAVKQAHSQQHNGLVFFGCPGNLDASATESRAAGHKISEH